MTKIAHLTSGHPPTDIRILQKECRALAQAGYDVVLVAPAGEHEVDVPGVRLRSVPKAKGRLERFLRTPRHVYHVALQENADLYHLHDPELLPVARRLRREDRRVVFDMHENLPKDMLDKRWIPWGLRRVAAWGVKAALGRWLHRVPIILAEASYAADFPWIEDSCVVRNMPLAEPLFAIARQHEPEQNRQEDRSKNVFEKGATAGSSSSAGHRILPKTRADKPPMAPSTGQKTALQTRFKRPAVGYLGVVDSDHGSRVTLEALGRLAADGLKVALECVGPVRPQHARRLRRQVGRLGLGEVRLHGYLPPPEAWQRIASCRVGLALLAPKANLVDSYPTKLFEYMALGIPVVASDFPLYREVIEQWDCGRCVAPGDAREVARGVRWLLEHPGEARAMGRRGQEAVRKRYRWEPEAEKLLNLYARLLGSSANGIRSERAA